MKNQEATGLHLFSTFLLCDIVVFKVYILLPCQNLVPTLPTMQLDNSQLAWRFWCVILLAANVACSRDEELDATYILQPTLTQVTSLEDIYQTLHSWRR